MVKKYSIEKPLQGVVVLITGATSGIGYTAARALYKAGAHVFLACRNESKTQEVIRKMKEEVGAIDPPGQLEFLSLDTSQFASVRACASAFLAKNLPLHLLINNAGIGGVAKGNSGLSSDGYELVFATNHLGHFLLTQLLMEKLQATAKSLPADFPLRSVRVVNVASRAHAMVSKMDWDRLQKENQGFQDYGVSKACNMLFTLELARRWKEQGLDDKLKAFSLHPGVVATNIWAFIPKFLQPIIKWFMINEEEGSFTTLYCALSEDISSLSGHYFDNCQLAKPRSALATNEEVAKELWQKSEEWTGAK